jgi:hypothetical protein
VSERQLKNCRVKVNALESGGVRKITPPYGLLAESGHLHYYSTIKIQGSKDGRQGYL